MFVSSEMYHIWYVNLRLLVGWPAQKYRLILSIHAHADLFSIHIHVALEHGDHKT
jgi:hypothetical protein